ncbi:alpha/beta fold hydrolase [Pseudorhodobacter ferrugineus]|uniref:alpha/beta fold hydrolase n=1 Tax=Pseudorhodobacter ferrugineus TaxID=77008 RepID=UPI00049190EA|nr:alpha/beta fold hydrolase [Pseudorhodobacter ferrugineus]
MSYAQCGDHQIAYRDQGAQTGPAVVFAHAMGLDHSVWDAIIPYLPQTLRIIRYDLRGHGASATPPAPYSMGALVRDAEGLLDNLNIRDCVFVGSSIGGMVAQGLAVKRLDQIRALVIANSVTKMGTKDTWARLIEATKADGIEARHEADLAQTFSRDFRETAAIAPWATLLRTQRLEGFLGCAAAIAGTDFYTTTASLHLPALIIASSHDAVTPADMVRELAELIPSARFHLIRKAGHLPMIEQPAEFASALTSFLGSIGHG